VVSCCQIVRADAFIKSSAVAEMGDRLVTIGMGRKVGDCCAPFLGGTESPSNTLSPGPRPTSYHLAVWPQQTRAEKWGAAVPLSAGGAGFPSNTISPGLRPTSVPVGILIHPTVWPQYTNVTDRQTGQDNGPIAKWFINFKDHSKSSEMALYDKPYRQFLLVICRK